MEPATGGYTLIHHVFNLNLIKIELGLGCELGHHFIQTLFIQRGRDSIMIISPIGVLFILDKEK